MDLSTGEIIAGEKPDSGGFCPVGFYVPDWWDIHDGSLLPGSSGWSDDYEFPKGHLVLYGDVSGVMIHLGRFNI